VAGSAAGQTLTRCFLVTFTLPCELRSLARHNQKIVYDLLFAATSGTLKDLGLNPINLGARIGMTAILHTHNRRLDYHPHIHVVVPGGGVNKAPKQWIRKKGKYRFNAFALASVFRARFLAALKKAGLPSPPSLPRKWVVNCTGAGKGLPALKYLSRYLYRGVIPEKNIICSKNGRVTFRYVESPTGKTRCRTLKGEDFLWLLLQHVLPKGFRRVRDYGFLHGNAKKLLSLVQLVLRVLIEAPHHVPGRSSSAPAAMRRCGSSFSGARHGHPDNIPSGRNPVSTQSREGASFLMIQLQAYCSFPAG